MTADRGTRVRRGTELLCWRRKVLSRTDHRRSSLELELVDLTPSSRLPDTNWPYDTSRNLYQADSGTGVS